MKIVGIGLNKTGTKSLGQCMKHWQMKHISFSPPAFQLWRAGNLPELMTWVDRYQSFEDWPWPLIYREIDKAHPGSKFILTRRITADVWFESLCRHADRTGPTSIRKHVYGFEMPREHKPEYIRYYEDHLRSVRDYFKDRPDALLEVCWEEGHGWAELSRFLNLPKPGKSFPHANKSAA